MYESRTYRDIMGRDGLSSFSLAVEETDVWIALDDDTWRRNGRHALTEEVGHMIRRFRRQLLAAADARGNRREFFSSFVPLALHPDDPPLVREMVLAAQAAGTGPMAAVAGAFAEAIGRELVEKFSPKTVVVENGGDIWVSGNLVFRFPVYAGTSPLSGKLGLSVDPQQQPVGVCTSSGTVGHSVSLGKADSLTVVCRQAALADALATASCNKVKRQEDLADVIEELKNREDVIGAMGIMGEKAAVCGNCKVVGLDE